MAEKTRNKYQEWEQRRKEKLEEITGQIEDGMKSIMSSSAFREFLDCSAKFYRYSYRNTLLIYMQAPETSAVASYTDWQRKFGRQVKKGEKGIQIIAPAPYKTTREVDRIDPSTGQAVIGADGKPEKVEKEITIPRFKAATVFALEQTTGKPLPELGIKELEASVENYSMFLEAIRRVSPVPIRFDDIKGEARGYYDRANKEIVIQGGMPELQTLKTACHELVHSELHDDPAKMVLPDGSKKTKGMIETEAEASAYICLTHFGFKDVGDYSFPYLSSYASGTDMREFHASLATIQQISSKVIRGIEKEMREQLIEMDVDRYEIYQIPIGSEARDLKFVSMEEMRKNYNEISRDNYAMVYTAPLKEGDTLDGLYEKFNIDPPTDYAGHSLSVSDVVVMHQNHEDKAYYVDSVGFAEIPFDKGEPYVPGWDNDKPSQSVQHMAGIAAPGGSKAAVATNEGYFTIQQENGSYDFSFYDRDYNLISTGVIPDKDMTLTEAMRKVISDEGLTIRNEAIVFGDMVSKIDEKHRGGADRAADDSVSQKIADEPRLSRRDSVLKNLREKQARVNAEFGFDQHGHKVDRRKGEQAL